MDGLISKRRVYKIVPFECSSMFSSSSSIVTWIVLADAKLFIESALEDTVVSMLVPRIKSFSSGRLILELMTKGPMICPPVHLRFTLVGSVKLASPPLRISCLLFSTSFRLLEVMDSGRASRLHRFPTEPLFSL